MSMVSVEVQAFRPQCHFLDTHFYMSHAAFRMPLSSSSDHDVRVVGTSAASPSGTMNRNIAARRRLKPGWRGADRSARGPPPVRRRWRRFGPVARRSREIGQRVLAERPKIHRAAPLANGVIGSGPATRTSRPARRWRFALSGSLTSLVLDTEPVDASQEPPVRAPNRSCPVASPPAFEQRPRQEPDGHVQLKG